MATYTHKALKGATIFFIMSVLAGFVGYLVRLVLARNLTNAEYGLFYAVFALFGMLSLLRDMGMGYSLVKHLPEFNIHKKYSLMKGSIIITFINQILASFIICFVLFLFLKPLSIKFFHTGDASIIILLLFIMFVLMPFEKVFSFTFQGLHRMDYNSLIEFVRMLAVLVFAAVAFRYDVSPVVPCIAYIFAYLLEIFVFAPLFLRTFPAFFRVKAAIDSLLVKKLTFFGFTVMIGLVGSMIITYIDTLVITYFTDLEQVALYQVAMPTSKLLLYFTTAISIVVLPISSELWARNMKDKLRAGVDIVYRYSFVFIIPLAMLMFSFPELIIKVFFGQQYVGASKVLQILSLAGIIYTVCFINSNILSGIGKPKENTIIILVASLFNLMLNIILVPLMGISGAAYATLLSYTIMLVWTGAKIRHFVRVPMPWNAWIKTFFAGLLLVAFMYYTKNYISLFGDIVEMAIVGAAGVIIYMLILLLVKVISVREIKSNVEYALYNK